MPPNDILDLARQVKSNTEQKHISLLSGGFSSQAYKIDTGNNEPFVLLVERPGGVSQSNYAHGFIVLKLLQNHGYKYSPSPLWLKNDHKAIAISFFDGVSSEQFKFNEKISPEHLAIEVMDSLLETSFVTLEEYQQLASKYNVEQPPIETPIEVARQYGTEWFELVKKSCPDKDIVDWLEPRVIQSVELAKSLGDNKPIFGHGDPSNPNILISQDGTFKLIDWDSSRFHTTIPEFFIYYTTHLTDFMKPYREVLIRHVSERLSIPVEVLNKKVTELRHFSEVFDVNWAGMMMAKVNSGETTGNINEFRKIAKERIKKYEESFED